MSALLTRCTGKLHAATSKLKCSSARLKRQQARAEQLRRALDEHVLSCERTEGELSLAQAQNKQHQRTPSAATASKVAAARRSEARAVQLVARLTTELAEVTATASKRGAELLSITDVQRHAAKGWKGAAARAAEAKARVMRAAASVNTAKGVREERDAALAQARSDVTEAHNDRRRHQQRVAAAQPHAFRRAVEQLTAQLGSKRVVGMLCDLGVTVNSNGATVAVNAVLQRQLVQTVVVDTRSTGTAVAAFFKSRQLGRVRCLIYDELPRNNQRQSRAPTPGAVPLLSAVTSPDAAARVMHSLLGSWWLVSDSRAFADERLRGHNVVDVHGSVQRQSGEVSGGARNITAAAPSWALLRAAGTTDSVSDTDVTAAAASNTSLKEAEARCTETEKRERVAHRHVVQARAAEEAQNADLASATRALHTAEQGCVAAQVRLG